MALTLEEITKACDAIVRVSYDKNIIINHLLTDSRQFSGARETLFVAIKGERHNGHQFIEQLYHQGLRYFLVSEPQLIFAELKEAIFLEVNDTLLALQQIATAKRHKFNLPVIGITGSNGKTIVKEWLGILLTQDFQIVKNPKSYNSQLGVPLSVWQIQNSHTLGIFEAGISQTQEMPKLEKIIIPSIGLLTNLGSAHDEGFTSRQEKLQEKLQLFKHCTSLIFCKDQTEVWQEVKAQLPNIETFTWGTDATATIRLNYDKKTSAPSHFTYQNQTYSLFLPFEDRASLENALQCLAMMVHLGIHPQEAANRLQKLPKVAMRLELKQGIHNSYLIDDTYNNDLVGLQVAIEFLQAQHHRPRKVLIVSDIPEVPAQQKSKVYHQFAKMLHNSNLQYIILIGKDCQKHARLFPKQALFFKDTASILAAQEAGNLTAILQDALILLKAARHFELEQLVQRLQAKVHGTVLEINLDALVHNLNFYRRQLHNDTKLMVMVKAFAYGSGSAEVAHLLQFHRVDYLAVAYTDEGVTLRQNGITLPIMVMNPQPETFDKMLRFQLEPELYNFTLLEQYAHLAKQGIESLPLCHLKFDTGMKRLGFEAKDLPKLQAFFQANKQLKVASVFSHLAAADSDEHEAFSRQQITSFSQMAEAISQTLGYQPLRHLLNSSGILRYPEAQFEMARLGIGLYGVEPNDLKQSALLPISSLKTCISQIKILQPGETIGYGRSESVKRTSRIATLAIGYADGFSRQLSNRKGKVCINGHFVPVIGRVCMDMTMVDITDIEAEEGDEVIIFGEDLPISEIAQILDTIPYEVLTNVSERVKRVFLAG